jgi:hypothetical protein
MVIVLGFKIVKHKSLQVACCVGRIAQFLVSINLTEGVVVVVDSSMGWVQVEVIMFF